MRRRTTIDLDLALVREAGGILGTTRTSDTIDAGLRAVVDAARRRSLLSLRPDLTLEDLEADRAGRYDDQDRRRSPRGS